jgi:hypothetical protein
MRPETKNAPSSGGSIEASNNLAEGIVTVDNLSILSTYHQQIAEHHWQAQQKAGEAVQHAIEAGKLLSAAKSEVKHGEWLSFLKSSGVNPRTSQRYMRLAQNADKLNCDTHDAFGSINQALEYLSEPKAKPPVAGQYLYLYENSEQLWVWPYNTEFFHRVSLIETEDSGCLITGTKRPISWAWIQKSYPESTRMNETDGIPLEAFIYREATLGWDLNCGENYNPSEPWVSPHVELLGG